MSQLMTNARLWWVRLADALDLSINDEAEMRGLVKGMAIGLVIYSVLLILVPILAGGAQ